MDTNLNRRNVIIGAAAAAALFPLHSAVTRAQAGGGDWFAMVKAQHAIIESELATIVTSYVYPGPQRVAALLKLANIVTAHYVAEENVIYPALALHGMWVPSDELYLEQDHAKIMSAELSDDAMEGSIWIQKVKALQAAILLHAKSHEEENFFPALQAELTPAENAALTTAYAAYFAMIKPLSANA